jgi:hypothetical protein
MTVSPVSMQTPTTTIAQKPQRYPWHGVASFLLPGTGQFIKGDKEKGKRDLWLQIGLTAAMLVSAVTYSKIAEKSFSGLLDAEYRQKSGEKAAKFEKTITKAAFGGMALCVFIGAASLANKIHSAYDAYKNPPKNSVKELPKEISKE